MPVYDSLSPYEGDLPAAEELLAVRQAVEPESVKAAVLHSAGLADPRPPQRRADLPDTAYLREEMGLE